MVPAAGYLEAAVHVIGGCVIIGRAGSVSAEFGKCIPDGGCYGRVIRMLDGADEYVVHVAAKVTIIVAWTCGPSRLAQQGDRTIHKSDGDDQDADERLVSVFHNDELLDF